MFIGFNCDGNLTYLNFAQVVLAIQMKYKTNSGVPAKTGVVVKTVDGSTILFYDDIADRFLTEWQNQISK